MNTPTKLLGINVSYDEKGNNQMNFNLRKVQNLQTKLDIWQQKINIINKIRQNSIMKGIFGSEIKLSQSRGFELK